MEPSLVKNTTKSTNRRPSIESDESKKKFARACAPCRKRKVKCSGQQPCNCCSKNPAITCIYDKPQQKKNPPKPITENHEPRLQALEKFLQQFSHVLDKRKDPEPPLFSTSRGINEVNEQIPHHRLSITTTGRGLYVPDKYLRTDRVPDLYKPGMGDWNPVIQEIIPQQPITTTTEMIREKLLNIYFQFVDPVIPILHKSSFLHQLSMNRPKLLLNAVYCVASRWDMEAPSIGEEPRGWGFYQNAVNILDQQPQVELSTIQAVFLLLKYNEHVRRPGFIWRTRYYFQMIVRMCKDLGLTRDIVCTTPNMAVEIEKRKRTFWAIYCYDVMMSIENGTVPNFNNLEHSSLDIPHVLPDEAQEHEKVVHFILLTKIIKNQSEILDFLRQKFDRFNNTQWDEGKAFEQQANGLKTTIGLITSTTKFPQKESMCYTVCFLYLASCFATILLHRPYAQFGQTNPSPLIRSHQSHCTEAAINIKVITELILECNAFEDMYCSIRGIQQIVHYLSAAVTIFKEGNFEADLQKTMMITQRLASISPSTEAIGLHKQQQQLNSNNSIPITTTTSSNTPPPNTSTITSKRKSLHSQENIVEQLNLQHPSTAIQFDNSSSNSNSSYSLQDPSLMSHNTSLYNTDSNNNMSLDPHLPNIPNHQSLLGLLLYNEDEGSTRNNIPT
ncbi:unnamed protein product [Mucor hiemalis]